MSPSMFERNGMFSFLEDFFKYHSKIYNIKEKGFPQEKN